jgi:chaperonin GroES
MTDMKVGECTIKPLRDFVVVKEHKHSGYSEGGIKLADETMNNHSVYKPLVKRVSTYGTVVAVGPGKMNAKGKREPMNVKVGDEVRYEEYFANKVQVKGEQFLIMTEDQIIGTVEDDPAMFKTSESARKLRMRDPLRYEEWGGSIENFDENFDRILG